MARFEKTTTLEALLNTERLRAEEAVAVVLAIGDRLRWTAAPPFPSAVVLSVSGEVLVGSSESEPAEARHYAQFLHDLLPEPGAGDEFQVPGPLRLAVARGLRLIDLPQFGSAAVFGTHLRRFATGSPRDLVARMVARRIPEQRPARATWHAVVATAGQPWAERRVNAPRVDVLRGMLREADLQRFALLEAAARTWSPAGAAQDRASASDLPLHAVPSVSRSDITLVRDAHHTRDRSARGAGVVPGRHLRRAGGAALAVVMSFGGSYLLVRELQDVTTRGRVVGSGAGIETSAPGRFVTDEHQPLEPVPQGDVAAQASASSAIAGTSDATRVRSAVVARTALARRLPLDEGRRTYSPSFAPEGHSVYFHSEHAGGSRLMRARFDGRGDITRVTTLLDDGAKNFHPRVSPDGEWVAFDSDREGERAVFVARRDGSGVRRVSGPGYAAVPTWAPDARTLAMVRAERRNPRVWNLWVLDLDSGEERRLTAHRSGQAWPGAWFADERLVYTHEDRLHVLDTRTGRRTSFASPHRGRLVRTAAVAPDERRVAFQVHRDGMWVLDLQSGAMQRVLDDPTAEEFAWAPTGTHVAFHSRRAGDWAVWMAPAP